MHTIKASVMTLTLLGLLAANTMMPTTLNAAVQKGRPNIIWIVVEDQSRHYGCYGEPLVDTPTIDRLAHAHHGMSMVMWWNSISRIWMKGNEKYE